MHPISRPFLPPMSAALTCASAWLQPRPRVLVHRNCSMCAPYRCADYPSLSTILNDFLGTRSAVRDCVIASAGFQRSDGTVITTNLPWPLSPHRLRADLNLAEVCLVNDFEALAYATEDMEPAQLLHLTGPAKAQDGPRLLLGPGTGLGAALWIPNNGRPIVLPTEAGQAALPSTTELEMQLVRHMLNNRTHVPIEHALSGPGISQCVPRLVCATVRPPPAREPRCDQSRCGSRNRHAVITDSRGVLRLPRQHRW